jgi:hypothetical protein
MLGFKFCFCFLLFCSLLLRLQGRREGRILLFHWDGSKAKKKRPKKRPKAEKWRKKCLPQLTAIPDGGGHQRNQHPSPSSTRAPPGGFDDVSRLLGDAVRDRLEMRGGDQGEDAGVDDAEVGGAVDDEVVVDDPAVLAREHGGGSRGVELGADAALDPVGEELGRRVRRDAVGLVRRLQLEDGAGGEEGLVELQSCEQGGQVERVGGPARVDGWLEEGVWRRDLHRAAGERVHEGDGEAAGVVVEDFIRRCVVLWQAGE